MRHLVLMLVVAGLGIFASQAEATRCSFDYVDGNNDYYAKVFQRAEAIVHARIVEVDANKQARIVIIESFKGRPKVLSAPARGLRTARLKAGDEAIYVVSKDGAVDECSTLPVNKEILDRFRAYSRRSQPSSTAESDARKSGARGSP